MRWQRLLNFSLVLGTIVASAGGLRAQTLPAQPPAAPNADLPPAAKEDVPLPPTAARACTNGCTTGCQDGGARTAAAAPSSIPPSGATIAPTIARVPWDPHRFQRLASCRAFYLRRKDNTCAPVKLGAWADFSYNYRSTGPGTNLGYRGRAPVMDVFGDEPVVQQLGLMISKPLDKECWSWGFNIIRGFGGADATFLTPTRGWYRQTNERMGFDFTDLNLTAHLPILTDGGVDIKAGRQTTILGPMGALSWQRPLNSSDYAWYNMEEGRYTGVSSIWHVNKQLDWYNGIEFGWGTFFAQLGPAPQYITNVSYWLDEDAKDTKVWFTLLAGPTSTGSRQWRHPGRRSGHPEKLEPLPLYDRGYPEHLLEGTSVRPDPSGEY